MLFDFSFSFLCFFISNRLLMGFGLCLRRIFCIPAFDSDSSHMCAPCHPGASLVDCVKFVQALLAFCIYLWNSLIFTGKFLLHFLSQKTHADGPVGAQSDHVTVRGNMCYVMLCTYIQYQFF